MERFYEQLKTVVEMDHEERESGCTTDEGETFDDLQRAYGFLLSACKLREAPPPDNVSNNNYLLRILNIVIVIFRWQHLLKYRN